jgi:uncharacterized membrane protein YuzA (DUF378 family)
MVTRWFARVLGIVLALLAVIGFFVEGEHLLGFMNVDIALDVVRLVLAALLIWAGFFSEARKPVNIVLWIVGASYLLLAIMGMIDPNVFGLLPTGLTGFDLVFHIIVGIAAIVVTFITDRTDASADRRTATPRT